MSSTKILNILVVVSIGLLPNHETIAQGCSKILDDHLLFADKNIIWTVNVHTRIHKAIATSPQATSLVYDYERSILYWSDLLSGEVNSLNIKSLDSIGTVITEQHDWIPQSIALDSITQKLYVAERTSNTIRIFDLIRGYEGILAGANFTDIRVIDIDPYEGYLFVLDKYEITRMDLDGTNRIPIISSRSSLEGVSSPITAKRHNASQTLDESWEIHEMMINNKVKRVFWINEDEQNVESSDYNGKNLKIHFHDKRDVDKTELATSMALINETLYWGNNVTQNIIQINQKGNQAMLMNVKPLFMEAISCTYYQTKKNPCAIDNGKCQHLCIQSRNSVDNYTCGCNIGYKLSKNGKSCIPVKHFILYTQDESLRAVDAEDFGKPFTDAIDPSNFLVNYGTVVDYDLTENHIYYSGLYPDDQMHQISMNGSNEKVLKPDIPSNNVGLFSFDWASKNLYYFTHYYNMLTLSVMNTVNATYSKTLINNVTGLIKDLTVHPNRGYIYFSRMFNNCGNISRMNMDGSYLTSIVNLTYSSLDDFSLGGLAVDYSDDRLYFTQAELTDADKWKIRVYHSNLDGLDIKILATTYFLKATPDIMEVFGNSIYIMTYESLIRLDKRGNSPSEMLIHTKGLSLLSGLKVVSPIIQSIKTGHPCSGNINPANKCEKFCFPTPKSDGSLRRVCGCPYGEKLAKDGLRCVGNSKEEPPLVPCESPTMICGRKTAPLAI
ncbi:hypothetical protein QAD02_006198 [Eretmocerus hayati]|uniref:Uncharacterized protein n=1 Tax=Eretmocerus hayati TaxID=131215 RepID=A0ACC2N0M1_9HYME|nr:hypothetical protein QAD02_006198 [Eretmocerus hayati]